MDETRRVVHGAYCAYCENYLKEGVCDDYKKYLSPEKQNIRKVTVVKWVSNKLGLILFGCMEMFLEYIQKIHS